MMSFFNTWILLASALIAPEGSFLPTNTRWIPVNEPQKVFLKKLNHLKYDLNHLYPEELQAWASDDHFVLNEIAREHELPITFDPFGENEFGSLALLQLDLLWSQKPEKISMLFKNAQNNSSFPVKGLLFSNGFKVYFSNRHGNPIAKIKTHSGDYFYITLADKQLQGAELSQKIKNIKKNLRRAGNKYNELLIPQFQYEGFVDISWLNGLHDNHDFMLKKAIEYVKLKCDENGCSVKAAGGFHFIPISVSHDTPLIMDKPFYFWIERSGCSMPLVEGYINMDAVRDETADELID